MLRVDAEHWIKAGIELADGAAVAERRRHRGVGLVAAAGAGAGRRRLVDDPRVRDATRAAAAATSRSGSPCRRRSPADVRRAKGPGSLPFGPRT